MTSKFDKDKKKITVTPDELVSSQYDIGMQNKKMERQAVKGLTPKFCYATLSGNQTVSNDTMTTIAFDTYDTNDLRMKITANKITIPAKGLYVITIQGQWTASVSGLRIFNLTKNGSTDLGGGFYVTDSETAIAGLTHTFMTVPLILDQGDEMLLQFYQDSGGDATVYATATTLRVISYILY